MDGESVRSAEGVGFTVEEATRRALEALGVSREQAYVEVVERPRRTFLGFRSGEVRVRAVVLPGAAGRAQPRGGGRRLPARGRRPAAGQRPPGDGRPPSGRSRPRPAQGRRPLRTPSIEMNYVPIDPETPEAQGALEILSRLIELMGLQAPVRLSEEGPKPPGHRGPAVALEVEGEDLGILIGRRGSTLEALEYLLRVMVNQRTGHWPYLTIDVNGYRRQRVENLRSLAQRMARVAQEEDREVVLEPMSPQERRVVHLTLQDHPQVETRSVGQGEGRKVTIRPRS